MAAKNGTAKTIYLVFMITMICIALFVLLFVATGSMTPISLDSSYHPVATCFHEHRI